MKYLIIPAFLVIAGIGITICGYILDDRITIWAGGFLIGVIVTAVFNKEKYHNKKQTNEKSN